MLHRNSLKQYVHLFNNFTDISVKATEMEGVREDIVGPWELRDIANMDQTPLQFSFNTKGATYAERGEKSVSTQTTGEGHDKRQCTVQLTIFAYGEPRIKPLLIFEGTGQRIPYRAKMQYDPKSRGQVPRERVVQRRKDGLLAQKYVEEAKHVWSTTR